MSGRFPLFATLFAAVYAVVYVVAIEQNYALFTYHPVLGEFAFLVEQPKSGPAMYWYGWMTTAAIAALLVGALAFVVPETAMKRFWTGFSWVIPLAMMLVVSYLLKDYFMPKVETPTVQQPAGATD